MRTQTLKEQDPTYKKKWWPLIKHITEKETWTHGFWFLTLVLKIECYKLMILHLGKDITK